MWSGSGRLGRPPGSPEGARAGVQPSDWVGEWAWGGQQGECGGWQGERGERRGSAGARLPWPEAGLRKGQEVAQWARQVRRAQEGGKVVGLYWTKGWYDLVLVTEAPDEQMMVVLLALASQGNVHTETLRAFDETEMESILQKL